MHSFRILCFLQNMDMYVEKPGTSLRGTILYISADNLAVHSAAGFQQSLDLHGCRAGKTR